MLRLTLRSGKDGRFLARIVDSSGLPFVLDFGDRRIIDDARQRLIHGFTMWRFGALVATNPQDPDLLVHLADFYCEGLLVAFEEPTWPGRDATLDERIPGNAVDAVSDTASTEVAAVREEPPAPSILATPRQRPISILDLEDMGAATDESTDLVEMDDMTDLGGFLEDASETPSVTASTSVAARKRPVPVPVPAPIPAAALPIPAAEVVTSSVPIPRRRFVAGVSALDAPDVALPGLGDPLEDDKTESVPIRRRESSDEDIGF